MAREDPVERSARGESIYEVTDWEPRTPLDRIVIRCYTGLLAGSRWAIVALAVAITATLVAATGLDLVAEPDVGWLVVLSALPALGLAAYLRYADVTSEEPLSVLGVTFLLAVLTAGFAGFLNSFGRQFLDVFTGPLGATAALTLYFFLVVGPVEESIKLLAVRLYAYDHHRFDAVIDGAVYGAVAGLGFATIENALYITRVVEAAGGVGLVGSDAVESVTASRALAGPGHVLYSAIAGYYLGLAKYTPERRGPIVLKGLLVAAVLHASYNSTVGAGRDALQTVTPLEGFQAVLVYVVCFQIVVAYFLYRKLDRYRRAYRAFDAGGPRTDPTPELTEFDP